MHLPSSGSLFLRSLSTSFGSGTLVDGNGSTHLENAKTITTEVIKTLGDPHADLGKQLSWSMTTVANRIKDDPESQIKKSQSVSVSF